MSIQYDQTSTSAFSYAFSDRQQATIREAISILETRIREADAYTNPTAVRAFCQLQLATELDEHFACMFLDSQHRLIAFERIFSGTIDGASVYPRVIVRRSLELNAAAIIFAHNHPSGNPTPSRADEAITQRLKDALALIDVRVLDHIIVGVESTVSMAELGQL